MTQTTEQKAPKVIADLIANLTALTANQPTTAEIEEALLTSKAITRGLFEWLASRYATRGRANLTGLVPSNTRISGLDRSADAPL
jgi:ribosomal protein L17